MVKKKNFLTDFIFVVLIIISILLFLNRGLTSKKVFFAADEIASDLVDFSFPYRQFFVNSLKIGQIPLWNQYVGSGLPFLAEAQTGIFYPLTIPLYLLFNQFLAFNLLIISTFLLIGIGTYFYARVLDLSGKSAFFSSLVFSLSGYMVAHLRHIPILTTISFMPLMFLSVEKIIRDKSRGWGVALAFFIAFSFFGGHLTTTYMILLILAIYFFARLWAEFKKRGKESLIELGIFICAFIFGILIAGIQLVPSAELYKHSTRTENEDISFFSSPYELKYLTLFVAPYAYGDPSRSTWNIETNNYWENIGYIGVIPLILSLGTIYIGFKKRNGIIIPVSIVVFISFILTLGANLPFYKLFWLAVPGFSVTRIPGRFLLFVSFFLSILAGFAAQEIKNKWIYLLILGFSIFDLVNFGYHLNNVIPASYFSPPKSVTFLKNQPGFFRIKSLENNQSSWVNAWKSSPGWSGNLVNYMLQRENLPPDYNLIFNLSSPAVIYEINGHFVPDKPAYLDAETFPIISQSVDESLKIFGMMNVKYILSAAIFPKTQNASLVFSDQNGGFPTYIYQNREVLPRAYLVSKVDYQSDDDSAFREVFSSDFEPANSVILQTSDKFQSLGISKSSIDITSYKDAEVDIKVQNQKNSILVLSDTFYPGWQAYLDGKQTKIYQADYAYRAIYIPFGSHNIKFIYKPESFVIGQIITEVSLGLLILIVIFSIVSRLKTSFKPKEV